MDCPDIVWVKFIVEFIFTFEYVVEIFYYDINTAHVLNKCSKNPIICLQSITHQLFKFIGRYVHLVFVPDNNPIRFPEISNFQ